MGTEIKSILLVLERVLNQQSIIQGLNLLEKDFADNFDAVLVKRLAKSNTIGPDNTGSQTHIALTGDEMDIFPYLNNYKYLEKEQMDGSFKRKYVLKLNLFICSNNLNYLKGQNYLKKDNLLIPTSTTTARSRRGDGGQQTELSYLAMDDSNFIDFRRLLRKNDYLIFLKYDREPKYIVIGIKEEDADKVELSRYIGAHFKSTETVVETQDIYVLSEENSSIQINEAKEKGYFPAPLNEMIYLLEQNPNLILYGPPGTGKTYYAKLLEQYFNYSQMITFHQSFSYEQFIEGVSIRIEEGKNALIYEVSEGILLRIATVARKNPSKRVALFIDEINRGNISKIFGELITLIEESKREGALEEARLILPYSRKEFSIPRNLFIIGTMNTSDRSVALLDAALRRRFSFYELMPDFTSFNHEHRYLQETVQAIKEINSIITKEINREHSIGNSYFFKLKDLDEYELKEKLRYTWLYQICPLLQEYFYINPRVITLLLGKMVISEDQNFSFGINYDISADELLEIVKNIALMKTV